jgi:hypothetical protein
MKETTFQNCIKFFNSFSENQIITRKEFLKNVKGNGNWTRDTYRNYFCKAGYLDTTSRGKYKINTKIPENMTTKRIQIQAYKENNLLRFLLQLGKEKINGRNY